MANPKGPLFKVAGGDASLQGIDEEPSKKYLARLPFGKIRPGGVLQGPLPKL